MAVDRQYVDSHGQSAVAFAFCYLLGFHLLPRLKGIHRQRLYRYNHISPYGTFLLDMNSRLDSRSARGGRTHGERPGHGQDNPDTHARSVRSASAAPQQLPLFNAAPLPRCWTI